jgi:Kef-type K+ transport system membrane component KefB
MAEQVFLEAITAICLFLLGAKLLAELFARVHLPTVLAELSAGIILGPLYFGGLLRIETQIIQVNEVVKAFGEIGAIVILFVAGLEMSPREFLKGGVASFTVGGLGVIFPFFVGYYAFTLLGFRMQGALMVATALTATSIAITIECLKEIDCFHTREAKLIVGSAVIDDILAIAVLGVVLSIAEHGSPVDPVSVVTTIAGVLAVFGIFLVASILIVPKLTDVRLWKAKGSEEVVVTAIFFGAAAVANLVGLSPIVGAFAVGMALADTNIRAILSDYIEKLLFLFGPMFFTVIGAQVDLSQLNADLLLMGLALVAIAIITKFVGCGLPALFFLKDRRAAARVGVGMISRGEVGLIVAGLAVTSGFILPETYSLIVLMVVVTTIITPILVKATFEGG